MSLVGKLLRKLGILPEFTANDMLDASIEDKFHEHQKAVAEVTNATGERRSSNERLRTAIKEAKSRSAPFAEFEQAARGRGQRNHHHHHARS